MVNVPTVKLNNGYEMPIFGLGTYAANEENGIQAVKDAIDAGYRHFDTALLYGNEQAIGKGIREKIEEGVVKREDIFVVTRECNTGQIFDIVVTKLWSSHHEVDRVEDACRVSLKNLNLDYIDLYLMHTPFGLKYNEQTPFPKLDDDTFDMTDVDYVDTWNAMEKLVHLGLVKSIGISNFNTEQITRLLSVAEIKPVNHQFECNPNLNQKKMIKFCKDHDIYATAYCPLGQPKPDKKKPDFFYDPRVEEIGMKYGKTPAQVILRFLIDLGAIPIPKSSNKQRIEENINIFDFKLTKEDMDIMETFNNNNRICKFTDGRKHKYHPFPNEC